MVAESDGKANMMNKADVIAFFDSRASGWDAELSRNEPVIAEILGRAGILPGTDVLDVACGTGVLIPDYLGRGVRSVVGVDISPEMIRVARSKFKQQNVRFLCADMESAPFDSQFDCAVVYNAFPHFPNPGALARALAAALRPGGRLTVAHGMSRAQIDSRHEDRPGAISVGLMPAEELAGLLRPLFDVDVVISDSRMYQVSGVKK